MLSYTLSTLLKRSLKLILLMGRSRRGNRAFGVNLKNLVRINPHYDWLKSAKVVKLGDANRLFSEVLPRNYK